MQLIFIYGPPAAGKLTIARELANLTNFRLYHNHLAGDLVESIFDREKHSHIFYSQIGEVNLLMLSKAAAEGIAGVIVTSCYIYPDDQEFIKKLIDLVDNYGGEINFAQIVCDQFELEKRVVEKSRKKFGKLQDSGKLQQFLKDKELYRGIDHPSHLSIDNTNISAQEVARMIKEYYDL